MSDDLNLKLDLLSRREGLYDHLKGWIEDKNTIALIDGFSEIVTELLDIEKQLVELGEQLEDDETLDLSEVGPLPENGPEYALLVDNALTMYSHRQNYVFEEAEIRILLRRLEHFAKYHVSGYMHSKISRSINRDRVLSLKGIEDFTERLRETRASADRMTNAAAIVSRAKYCLSDWTGETCMPDMAAIFLGRLIQMLDYQPASVRTKRFDVLVRYTGVRPEYDLDVERLRSALSPQRGLSLTGIRIEDLTIIEKT